MLMPLAPVKAHPKLNVDVDAAYGQKSFANDAALVAFLFERYQKYTSPLPTDKSKRAESAKKTD
jgi:hypothetical protein